MSLITPNIDSIYFIDLTKLRLGNSTIMDIISNKLNFINFLGIRLV